MEIAKVFNGRLDLDNAIEAVKDGDYTYMLDGIIGKSYDGARGTIENMMGTSALPATADMAGGVCIGGCRDSRSQTQFLFWRNSDPNKHTIVKVTNNLITKVMTWSGLNFQAGYRITGAAYINGTLYFTDSINGLRGFNVTKYVSSPPATEEEITLIKRGAIYSPTVARMVDAADVNLIQKSGFQFAYQYVYDDNQVSVVSPYSKLSTAGTNTAQNKIRVTIPAAETIPSNVKEIKFAVRVDNGASFQYIGSLKRSTDNFVTNYIDFFNTIYGGAVPTEYLSTYHDVPLKAKALEFIKNRLWLGNVVEGYDVPSAHGMTLTTVTQGQQLQVGDPVLTSVTLHYVTKYEYTVTNASGSTRTITRTNTITGFGVVYLGSNADSGRDVTGKRVTLVSGAYEIQDDPYTWNGDIDSSALGQIVPFAAAESYVTSGQTPPTAYTVYQLGSSFTANLRTFVQEGDVAAYAGSKTFPNGSQYKAGLIYKDKSGRTSSVVVSADDITTSDEVYGNVITASWTLPSGTNLNIPDWADSYHIVRTRNLTKQLFFEWKTARVKYYKGDVYSDVYASSNTGIYVDITPMFNVGLGYSFTEGDRIVLYAPSGGTTYNLQIKSYEAGIIKVDNVNLGTITNQNCIFEIYRPNVISDTLLFYEIGQGYPITNAGQGTRAFSVTSGSIDGDVLNVLLKMYTWSADYVLGTNGLFKEMSMDVSSPNWSTDIGKAHIISTISQKIRPYTFKHSAPIINDTQVNGLSAFYAADQADVPYENGEIFKLKAANRTASDGTVLLAICRNRVSSIYVDESRLNITSDVGYIVSGSQVIGQVNTLAGWHGTVHPESVFDDGNSVYWYSKPRRSFVRYSTNGVFPISEYNAIDFFEDVSISHSESDSIVGGYHPYYDLVISSYPNAPAGKKTFSYENGTDSWRGFHTFVCDYYFDLSEIFYGVYQGNVYRFNNDAAFGNFFGTQYPTKIEIPLNANADIPKIWQTALLYLSPNFIEWYQGDQRINTDAGSDLKVELYNDEGQSTDVLKAEFEVGENLAYAPLKKDANSTGGVANGTDMNSRTAYLRITFSGNDYRYVPMAKVGFIPSLGHSL
jgi:hypothetical protein